MHHQVLIFLKKCASFTWYHQVLTLIFKAKKCASFTYPLAPLTWTFQASRRMTRRRLADSPPCSCLRLGAGSLLVQNKDLLGWLTLLEFIPTTGWAAQGAESGTRFEDVDLTDLEWVEYDEKAGESVEIMEVCSRVDKYKK
jgi:hypothetical protein